eukprot:g5657.t1
MLIGLALLLSTAFGLVSPNAVHSSKSYNEPHITYARRSLVATKPHIDSYRDQSLKTPTTEEKYLLNRAHSKTFHVAMGMYSHPEYGPITKNDAIIAEEFTSQAKNNALKGSDSSVNKMIERNTINSEESTSGTLTPHPSRGTTEGPGCNLYMNGFTDSYRAQIDVDCNDGEYHFNNTINDIRQASDIPELSGPGFKFFDEVDGQIYAIHVSPDSNLVLKDVEINNFRGLGSIFLVENARLEIRFGIIRNIFESSHAGVMSVSNGIVEVLFCTFINTHGKHAGVATFASSSIVVKDSYFGDNFGTEESLVFYAENACNLSLTNSVFVGTLPHTDDESPSNEIKPDWENFQVVEAEAGVVYMTNASSLIIDSSVLKHFGSMKGLIYLEENSTLVCRNSSLVHNIAIYGGAIFSQDSSVQVSNVTAARNAASRGGAILLHGSFRGYLENVEFRSNLAAEGGAFFIELDECQNLKDQFVLSVQDCSFIRNQAYDNGGAVFTSCVSLNITNAVFIENTALLAGGAVYLNTSVVASLTNVNFSRNSAYEGGAIVVHSEETHGGLTVENGTFDGNEALLCSGGAIMFRGFHSTLIMRSNSFSNNTAQVDGGALFLAYTATLNISDATFFNNHAKTGSGGTVHISFNVGLRLDRCSIASGNANISGGGVYVYMSKSVDIQSCNVSDSTAKKEDGGGIALYAVGNITIKDTMVHGNFAASIGGGVSYRNPTISESDRNDTKLSVELINANFSSNRAKEGGGILLHSIEALNVINSFFNGNEAKKDGGGIHMRNVSTIVIQQSTMAGNKAKTGIGGAVYGKTLGILQVAYSHFLANVGCLYGGAISLLETPRVDVKNSHFEKNEITSLSGGALTLFDEIKITIEDTTFQSNKANKSGGAIYAKLSNITTIKRSNFFSNVAANEDGGGIYFLSSRTNYSTANYSSMMQVHSKEEEEEEAHPFSESTLKEIKFEKTSFKGNEAGRNGGGLYLDHLNGTLVMSNTPTFESCTAVKGSGGCAYLTNIAALDIERVSSYNNTAYMNGGCFFLMNIPQIDLNDSSHTLCKARKGNGGALYYDGDSRTTNNLLLPSAALLQNDAAVGGAYHISNAEVLYMDRSNFDKNRAHKGSGGCIIATNIKNLSMVGLTSVSNNHATESCGAMCLTRILSLKLSGLFDANVARSSHGGVAWLREVTWSRVEGSFTKNKGEGFGGALFATNVDQLHILSSSFTSNEAGRDGGAISIDSIKNFTIKGTSFDGNKATDGGGLHIGVSQREFKSLVQVKSCHFSGNRANVNGGGVTISQLDSSLLNSDAFIPSSPLLAKLLNCSFEHNKARNGGGLGVLAGDVIVTRGIFTENDASGSGGAMYIDDGDFTLVNHTRIEKNTARKGGALLVTCKTNMNFTFSLVRRNTAPKRDDGALIACSKANLFMANVTFLHNFRDHEWYWYIIFPTCSYALLFAFLICGVRILQSIFKPRKRTVTYETYSEIGEYDPTGADLSAFFADPAVEHESDDEGIVAPKPPPAVPEAKSAHAFTRSGNRLNDSEISEDSEESLPIPQHRYPPEV